MSVDASLVFGMRLFDSPDGVTYTEIADLKEMGPPGNPESPDVDVTPLTPSVGWREFRQGLLVAGEMDFKQFWNKTRHTSISGKLNTNRYWRVTFPDDPTPADATRVEFQGRLKGGTTSGAGSADDPITIDCKVKISGAITVTAAS